MKNLLASIALVAALCVPVFAGDIPAVPGPTPPPACTENCPGISAEQEPESEYPALEFPTAIDGLLAIMGLFGF